MPLQSAANLSDKKLYGLPYVLTFSSMDPALHGPLESSFSSVQGTKAKCLNSAQFSSFLSVQKLFWYWLRLTWLPCKVFSFKVHTGLESVQYSLVPQVLVCLESLFSSVWGSIAKSHHSVHSVQFMNSSGPGAVSVTRQIFMRTNLRLL